MEEIFKNIKSNFFESQKDQEKNQNQQIKDISDDTTKVSFKDSKILKNVSKEENEDKTNSNSNEYSEKEDDKKDEKEEVIIDEDEYAEYGKIDKIGIHFQIISDYNVSIEINPDNLLTDDVKQLILKYKGVFDTKMNLWLVPYVNYEILYNELYKIKGINNKLHKVGSIAKECYEHKNLTTLIIKRKKKEEKIEYLNDTIERKIENLPKKLRKSLYDFQIDGIKFGIEHHCRFLLADEMGVGKTIQAISLAYIYRDSWPVLIICPGSMKYLWKGEIQKWLGLKDYRINILNSSKQRISQEAYFYVISYDLVHNILKKLKKMTFDFVILDEAHSIKNKESLRAKNILPIAIRAKRLILMTGTPLLAKPYEGYTLLYALRPDLFSYFKKFAYRYCDPQPTPFGTKWSGASNTKELHWILSTLMIRRLKKDILNYLPPKRRQKILVKTDPEIIAKIRELRSEIKGRTGTLESYTLTASAKKEGVCEYINDVLESTDEKIIVFGYHHEMLDRIELLMEEKKVDFIRIDGTTKQEIRYEYVNYFQKKKNCRVAILSIIAASTGITLNSAHIVLFAELTWTPSIMIQAEDRAHRIGQKSEYIDIKYLYGEETLDDFILEILQKKLTIVSTTIDDKKEILELSANPDFIHVKKSHPKTEKYKGEIYLNIDDNIGDNDEIDENNIEKKMMNDLNLDIKKNNIEQKNNKKINNNNNLNDFLNENKGNFLKTNIELNVNKELNNNDFNLNNLKNNENLNDKFLNLNNDYSNKEIKISEIENKEFDSPKNNININNNDLEIKNNYFKNNNAKYQNNDFNNKNISQNLNLSAQEESTKNLNLSDRNKTNEKFNYNSNYINNLNKTFNNFLEKLEDDNNKDTDKKEENNNIDEDFKYYKDNLLINLHKTNMRINISQDETKQTQNLLDLNDKSNEKYISEPKTFLFINHKKIFK